MAEVVRKSGFKYRSSPLMMVCLNILSFVGTVINKGQSIGVSDDDIRKMFVRIY